MAIFIYFLLFSVSIQIFMISIMLLDIKIKVEPVDKLNLILTNLTLCDQHYFVAISESSSIRNQTILALAAKLLIDIPNDIISY